MKLKPESNKQMENIVILLISRHYRCGITSVNISMCESQSGEIRKLKFQGKMQLTRNQKGKETGLIPGIAA